MYVQRAEAMELPMAVQRLDDSPNISAEGFPFAKRVIL